MGKYTYLLSKSRLMRGLQCAKSLYLTLHSPELESAPELKNQNVAHRHTLFNQGNEVGLFAQKNFPNGVTIEAPYYDAELGVLKTENAIKNGASTIFEATFVIDGISARIDIFHREPDSKAWQIIEVKSSTKVKPEYIDDVAIQMHILDLLKIPYEKAFLMYINKESTAPELKDFFIKEDVTEKAIAKKSEIEKKIKYFKEVLANKEVPKIDIGKHCTKPYDCPFINHCWKHIPTPSIFDFPDLRDKAWDFYKNKIINLHDQNFGPFEGLNAKRLEAVRKNERWADKEQIAAQLSTWKWPLAFLDFETIGYAIPKYIGTHPYEQVPFQFSLIVQKERNGVLQHFEYLHKDDSEPREAVVEHLVKNLNNVGSVVAYYKSFEEDKLRGLANFSQQYSEFFNSLCEKLVDPLPIFRSAVYEAAFNGSFSIKSVAPAILGSNASYEEMPVSDGTAAQRAFLELIDPKTSQHRKKQLERDMLEYCKKDTYVMMDLVNWLFTNGALLKKSA